MKKLEKEKLVTFGEHHYRAARKAKLANRYLAEARQPEADIIYSIWWQNRV